MNGIVWGVQIGVALLACSGGAYKIFAFDVVAMQPWYAQLSRPLWSTLGAFELACGVLLLAPMIVPRARGWVSFIAGALALENLLLAVLYGRYSLAVSASNPMVWAVLIAVLALIVAAARHARSPGPASPGKV